MSITLIFNGGLFVLPGGGRSRKVTTHLARPLDVTINDDAANGLAGELTAAYNVDFISGVGQAQNRLPMRHLSQCLAIKYRDFEKVVSFMGGRVIGHLGVAIPQHQVQAHANAQATADNLERLTELGIFLGDDYNPDHDDDYLNGIVQQFAATRETERWVKGYEIQVQIEHEGTLLFLDGEPPANQLVEGMRIEFLVDEGGEIPHFNRLNPEVVNNPHVLEQPPTI